jgi:hypothetical protein
VVGAVIEPEASMEGALWVLVGQWAAETGVWAEISWWVVAAGNGRCRSPVSSAPLRGVCNRTVRNVK